MNIDIDKGEGIPCMHLQPASYSCNPVCMYVYCYDEPCLLEKVNKRHIHTEFSLCKYCPGPFLIAEVTRPLNEAVLHWRQAMLSNAAPGDD